MYFKKIDYGDYIVFAYRRHKVDCQKYSTGWKVDYWRGLELKFRKKDISSKQEAINVARTVINSICKNEK